MKNKQTMYTLITTANNFFFFLFFVYSIHVCVDPFFIIGNGCTLVNFFFFFPRLKNIFFLFLICLYKCFLYISKLNVAAVHLFSFACRTLFLSNLVLCSVRSISVLC
uniref:Uncharacterized protein n=1 Tax=Trypanosoma vivax (strain Y486) TaxID=1055687 RepID=G0U6T6_TRYVY|nr:hypothetical protein TVY486_1006400 [Trypanosoma vivax Y486]